MKFIIKHEIPGRLRIHLCVKRMSFGEADTLEYFLNRQPAVRKARVYERTADAVIEYTGNRKEIILPLSAFSFSRDQAPKDVVTGSSREMNASYKEKLLTEIFWKIGKTVFMPVPLKNALAIAKSVKYISSGLSSLAHRRLDVPVLDASAITMSMIRGDFNTAGNVMFLLTIGEIMEEWTHKKSVADLAQSMSLRTEKVWLLCDGQEVLVSSDQVTEGCQVVVHMGTVIPFDGVVLKGEGNVNQASLTGEGLPVRKAEGGYVYAGTVLEEGELTVEVKKASGASRYEKVMAMIEETEKLKSEKESRAEHLADRLVPYTLGGTLAVWLLTRNITKTMSVLMVDFSCALKLSMPITVLSAIRESGAHHITVKGGKYLEAVAEATTVVFDKTGTLTKARPQLHSIVSFCDMNENELLRIAACLEEHFPHPMAKAVVEAACQRHLVHEEMHSKVDYIVAHGISSYIEEHHVIIGSYHFIFDDENCEIAPEFRETFDALPPEYTYLFMAEDGRLIAVIAIEDPVREETTEVLRELRNCGFEKLVMMTGDSERTAAAVAREVGLDEYYAEVLPEDKAAFVKQEKAAGRKVLMVGDGINDSPALSAADVGIAISDGAELAREIADITISATDLYQLVMLKRIANAMVRRIDSNYRNIVGINGLLIALGVLGVIQPTTSAMLHNISTIGISVSSMSDLVKDTKK